MSSFEDIPKVPIPELSMNPVFDSNKKKPTNIELTEEKKKEFEDIITAVNSFSELYEAIKIIREVDVKFCSENILNILREIQKSRDPDILNKPTKSDPSVIYMRVLTRTYELRPKIIELVGQFPRK